MIKSQEVFYIKFCQYETVMKTKIFQEMFGIGFFEFI